MNSENLDVIRGRGYRAFQQLCDAGKIERDDLVTFVYRGPLIHPPHSVTYVRATAEAVLCDAGGLLRIISTQPHAFPHGYGGYDNARDALLSRAWEVKKKV